MRSAIILRLAILSLGICMAGSIYADPPPLPGANPNSFALPPPPPAPDANPKVRHPVTVQLPTGLKIERIKDVAQVTFIDYQKVKLPVGLHMTTGIISGTSCYLSTDPRQPPTLEVIEGPDLEHVDSTTDNVLAGKDTIKIPQPGKEYTIERQLTIFETDVPTQHMWDPGSGKYYKVLWTKTFKGSVK